MLLVSEGRTPEKKFSGVVLFHNRSYCFFLFISVSGVVIISWCKTKLIFFYIFLLIRNSRHQSMIEFLLFAFHSSLASAKPCMKCASPFFISFLRFSLVIGYCHYQRGQKLHPSIFYNIKIRIHTLTCVVPVLLNMNSIIYPDMVLFCQYILFSLIIIFSI